MASFGAGQLSDRVAWDEREKVADGYGGTQARFVEHFICSAGFIPLRGGEAVLAARLVGRQPIVVRVRAERRTRLISHGWRMRDVRAGEWVGSGADMRWTGKLFFVKSVMVAKENPLFLDVLVESEGVV